MSTNETVLLSAYGEAVLHSHLLEDFLKAYLFDCAFFGHSCMAQVSQDRVKRASFEDLIDMIALAEPHDPASETLAQKLHLIRKIRNQLVHGFIHQIHEEIKSDAGRDQISAMLRRFSDEAHAMHQLLLERGRSLQQQVVRKNFKRIFEHPDHLKKEGTVATSDIQKLIEQLSQL